MAMEALPSVEREYAVSLDALGWILILSRATRITFGLLFKATRAALGGSKKSFTSFYEYMAYQGMLDYQSGLDAVGIQNLLPSTAKVCSKVARKQGIPHTEILLGDGTKATRFGLDGTEKVIVLFHGGGYMAPALPEHAKLACGFSNSLPKNTCAFVLQYALASETGNHYPRQLQQAVSLMEYLLHSQSVQPSNITLIGDSAGGHLALSLLLHLAHPNPRVSPLAMEGRLSGVALISPWAVNASPEYESMKSNEDKDILSTASLNYWTRNFMGDSMPDHWNSLLTTPAEWWADLPVEDILIMYGDNEVLRDGISELCNAIQAGHERTTATKFSGELHTHMLTNRFLHINKPCESEKVFLEWFDGHFKD
ncbi:Alpha/Beta hydrolase protein [Thelonectria olida]|uniref:Alpha/Beta hydrolase protein n=1 Tax=Thelonectria olida TaxID=1576542 RepID=A0A9P8W3X4_9HYPO|nr:Alpha/Beta hydrolase protein [Thelonectria olida]